MINYIILSKQLIEWNIKYRKNMIKIIVKNISNVVDPKRSKDKNSSLESISPNVLNI